MFASTVYCRIGNTSGANHRAQLVFIALETHYVTNHACTRSKLLWLYVASIYSELQNANLASWNRLLKATHCGSRISKVVYLQGIDCRKFGASAGFVVEFEGESVRNDTYANVH